MEETPNLYNILQVDRGASFTEIKLAFRRLAIIEHPDKPGGSEEEFRALFEAYKTLSDTAKRREYDIKVSDSSHIGASARWPRLIFVGPSWGQSYRLLFSMPPMAIRAMMTPLVFKQFPDDPNPAQGRICAECGSVSCDVNPKQIITQLVERLNVPTCVADLLRRFIPADVFDWKPRPVCTTLESFEIPAFSLSPSEQPHIHALVGQSWVPYTLPDVRPAVVLVQGGVSRELPATYGKVLPLPDGSSTVQVAFTSEPWLTGLTVSVAARPVPLPTSMRSECFECRKPFGMFLWRYTCAACGEVVCKDCLLEVALPLFGFSTPQLACQACRAEAIPARLAAVIVDTAFAEDRSEAHAVRVVQLAWCTALMSRVLTLRVCELEKSAALRGFEDLLLNCLAFREREHVIGASRAASPVECPDWLACSRLFNNPSRVLFCLQRCTFPSLQSALLAGSDVPQTLVLLRLTVELKQPSNSSLFLPLLQSLARDCKWREIAVLLREGKKLSRGREVVSWLENLATLQPLATVAVLRGVGWPHSTPDSGRLRVCFVTAVYLDDPAAGLTAIVSTPPLIGEWVALVTAIAPVTATTAPTLVAHCARFVRESSLSLAIVGGLLLEKSTKSGHSLARLALQLADPAFERAVEVFGSDGSVSSECPTLKLESLLHASNFVGMLDAARALAPKNTKAALLYYSALHRFDKSRKFADAIAAEVPEVLHLVASDREALYAAELKSGRSAPLVLLHMAVLHPEWPELIEAVLHQPVPTYGRHAWHRDARSRLAAEGAMRAAARLRDRLMTALNSFSTDALVKILLRITARDVSTLNDVLRQLLGGAHEPSDALPPTYRALLLLLQSALAQQQQQPMQAMSLVRSALLADSSIASDVVPLLVALHPAIEQAVRADLTRAARGQSLAVASPLSTAVVPPPLFANRLRDTTLVLTVRKFEAAIHRRMRGSDVAFSYLDLAQGAPMPIVIVNCLLLAAHHLLLAGEAQRHGQLVQSMILEATACSCRSLSPVMQLSVNIIALDLLRRCGACSPVSQLFLEQLQDRILALVRHVEVVFPLSPTIDALYYDVASREYLVSRFSNSPDPMHVYFLFEGAWLGWYEDPRKELEDHANETDPLADTEDMTMKRSVEDEGCALSDLPFSRDLRQRAMAKLLGVDGFALSDVQRLLDWPIVLRDNTGWLGTERSPLQLVGKAFSSFRGVQINLETGELGFLLEQGGEPLFTADDIAFALCGGVDHGFFTLEEPDGHCMWHPCQEMRYGPSSLHDSDYLSTLLHADYLLKMMTTGVEVCALSPFDMRPFRSRLPPSLAALVAPIHELADSGSALAGNAHRFWIEAGDIPFEVDESGASSTYRFGSVAMQVKKHSMKRDAKTGKLIDDESDDQTSPEARFARSFTENYDIIGKHYPELLRLRELTKISAAVRIVQGSVRQLKANLIKPIIDRASVRSMLVDLSSQLVYPRSHDVESELSSCLQRNNVRRSDVPHQQLTELRSSIAKQLAAADRHTEQSVADVLTRTVGAAWSGAVRSNAISWMGHRRHGDFADFIADAIESQKRDVMRAALHKLDQLCIGSPSPSAAKPPVACAFVPAAFVAGRARVYGGVSLQSNLVSGNGGSRVYRIHSAHVLMRGANEAGPHHNFPAHMDRSVFAGQKTQVSASYHLYKAPGHLNGHSGNYEIGVRPHITQAGNTVEVITHRFFRKDGRK